MGVRPEIENPNKMNMLMFSLNNDQASSHECTRGLGVSGLGVNCAFKE